MISTDPTHSPRWSPCSKGIVGAATLIGSALVITGLALTLLKGRATLHTALLISGGSVLACDVLYTLYIATRSHDPIESTPKPLLQLETLRWDALEPTLTDPEKASEIRSLGQQMLVKWNAAKEQYPTKTQWTFGMPPNRGSSIDPDDFISVLVGNNGNAYLAIRGLAKKFLRYKMECVSGRGIIHTSLTKHINLFVQTVATYLEVSAIPLGAISDALNDPTQEEALLLFYKQVENQWELAKSLEPNKLSWKYDPTGPNELCQSLGLGDGPEGRAAFTGIFKNDLAGGYLYTDRPFGTAQINNWIRTLNGYV